MIPIISVVGKSNIGKTTFLEKLVVELKQRGIRVATIKHDTHSFELDKPGKDSWRMAQAGSDQVLISSPNRMALIAPSDRDLEPEELVSRFVSGVDIVLTEGYKRGDKRKIEVSRREFGPDLLCSEDELIAIVADQPFDFATPQFGLEDVVGVADLLERDVIGPAGGRGIVVSIDGKPLPLKPFVEKMLIESIVGLLKGLDGTEGREVRISLRH